MEKIRDAAVLIIAVSRDGRMVVVNDPSFSVPFWKIPGGHIEEGENPAEGASRELREETGIRIPWKRIGVISSKEKYSPLTKRKYTLHVCIGVVSSWTRLLQKGSDEEEVALLPIKEALSMDGFLLGHKEVIKRARYFLYKIGINIA